MGTARIDPAELIRLAARLDHRLERETLGLFKIERFGSFVRAMDTGAELAGIIVCMRLVTSSLVQMLARRARQQGVLVVNVSPEAFRTQSSAARASGIIGIVRQKWAPIEQISPKGIWVGLDSIQSPGNLGCIMRTCEASGVKGMIFVGSEIDPYHPSVVGSSMGSIFGLSIVRAGLKRVQAWAKDRGVHVVGSSPTAPVAWDEFRYPDKLLIWLGHERSGMTGGATATCEQSVRIPIYGHADSLNVATAAGIIIYEAVRQRRSQADSGLVEARFVRK